ncbi:MAG: hypothetical protein ACLS48_09420 [[Eubacterium] siraeum]
MMDMTHFMAEMVTYQGRWRPAAYVFIETDLYCTPFTMETQCDKVCNIRRDLRDEHINQERK